MADIEALRSQTYNTNLQMLLQQKDSKLAIHTTEEQGSGKAHRMTSQIDSTEMQDVTTRALPAMDINIDHTGRWVYPLKKGWGRVVDDVDTLQTNISPTGKYVQSAAAAAKRKRDDMFLDAFYGTSKVGETGTTSLTFATSGTGDGVTTEGHVVAVTEGVGSATGMNVEKLEAALELALASEVDLDMENIFVAMSPKQHRQLKDKTVVTSGDFNNTKVLAGNGIVQGFNGFQIIISNRLPLDGNGYRRNPVWVPSGMGKAFWKPYVGVVRNRSDLHGNPLYVEADFMEGYTRLEGKKCIEIKNSEA